MTDIGTEAARLMVPLIPLLSLWSADIIYLDSAYSLKIIGVLGVIDTPSTVQRGFPQSDRRGTDTKLNEKFRKVGRASVAQYFGTSKPNLRQFSSRVLKSLRNY